MVRIGYQGSVRKIRIMYLDNFTSRIVPFIVVALTIITDPESSVKILARFYFPQIASIVVSIGVAHSYSG